jgi:hypothetical protein
VRPALVSSCPGVSILNFVIRTAVTIGKSQPKWAASKMETPGSQRQHEISGGGLRVVIDGGRAVGHVDHDLGHTRKNQKQPLDDRRLAGAADTLDVPTHVAMPSSRSLSRRSTHLSSRRNEVQGTAPMGRARRHAPFGLRLHGGAQAAASATAAQITH